MCTKECSTKGACPFSFTEESELVQNYGCLPTPQEIVDMRVKSSKTWACHNDYTKPCLGAIKYMRASGIECTVVDKKLVTELDNWAAYLTE